jgi:hypothetical protein
MGQIDRGEAEAERNGIERSPEWPRVERAHLVEQPSCQCCKPGADATAGKQVHHIFPFHYCVALGRPDLELDDRNLITLCQDEEGKPGQDHHLLVGHLDDFQSSNLGVTEDAARTFFGMDANAIRADAAWVAKCKSRLVPLDQMTDADKKAFEAAMNTRFPRK